MSALERVARRIGMQMEEHPTEPRWWDDWAGEYVAPSGLRAHLLTGDRPLRILAWMRAQGMAVIIGAYTSVDIQVSRGIRKLSFTSGDDIAACILAAAEALPSPTTKET